MLFTVSLFTGTMKSDVFYQWVVDDLLPKLPENAVVIMDNASFHKRADIQTAITDARFTLEYLPAYSPIYRDLSRHP